MADRAMQALAKQALEPEWEAKFEPNSYGFRPGRSAHDAIEAIFNAICPKPKYVLDTDIEKCFDRISHEALLLKQNAIQPIMRLVGAWLKAGIVDEGKTIFPEEGVPQGGVISPLLCNVALHGLEEAINRAAPRKYRAIVVRYADDLVKGDKSPYDGEWVYWVQRLGRDPTKSTRTIRLLKRQGGQCSVCGLYFTTEDVMEIHHWDENRQNNRYANLGLLHAHCHDQIHGERYQ
jgi:retron-type reverse transcriptase